MLVASGHVTCHRSMKTGSLQIDAFWVTATYHIEMQYLVAFLSTSSQILKSVCSCVVGYFFSLLDCFPLPHFRLGEHTCSHRSASLQYMRNFQDWRNKKPIELPKRARNGNSLRPNSSETSSPPLVHLVRFLIPPLNLNLLLIPVEVRL